MKNLIGLFLVLTMGVASAADTKLTWHGHATFSVVTPSGKVLVIDPWFKGNPKNPNGKSDNPYQGVEHVDFILLTHAHPDHVADVTPLGKKTGASLVTNYDLGNQMVKLMGYPKEKASIMTLMNIGGQIAIADGEVTVAMTEAKHSSGLTNPFAGESANTTVPMSRPSATITTVKADVRPISGYVKNPTTRKIAVSRTSAAHCPRLSSSRSARRPPSHRISDA